MFFFLSLVWKHVFLTPLGKTTETGLPSKARLYLLYLPFPVPSAGPPGLGERQEGLRGAADLREVAAGRASWQSLLFRLLGVVSRALRDQDWG